ncbi:MAG: nicotinate (nicotinamide) nucleotide adenylyltransferase [Pseudohongiellaceae bacterium]
MITRLGILGGMFDPVHNGHIAAARYAIETLSLDELRMIPCAIPNHRAQARASGSHRLTMLELATGEFAAITIDAIEIRRPGISYSADTLAFLREARVAEHIVFVLGIDSFNTLTQWHDWSRLLELSHFFVLGREGAGVDATTASAISLDERLVETPDALFSRGAGNVLISSDFRQMESSSEVRRLLRENEDTSAFLDPRVQLYIEDNRLYR